MTRWQLDAAARAGEALAEGGHQMLVRALHWPGVVHSALTTRVGQTPCDVTFEAGSLKVLRYRRATPATQPKPLLICYALINRPYILDLQQHKSVVQRYLDEGFDVYLIDWGVPTYADRGLGLAHYVVPEGQALAKAFELAERIAKNSRTINTLVLQTLPAIETMPPEAGLYAESMAAALSQTGPDAEEGLRAFLEKRAPNFT